MSVKPARASASICQTMSGLPPTSSSGFGVASDSGRMPLAAAGGEDHRAGVMRAAQNV